MNFCKEKETFNWQKHDANFKIVRRKLQRELSEEINSPCIIGLNTRRTFFIIRSSGMRTSAF